MRTSLLRLLRRSVSPVVLTACGLAVAGVAWAQAPEGVRSWKDATGKFEVVAELVKVEDGVAHLKRDPGGAIVQVPLAKLSQGDRRIAMRWKPAGTATTASQEASDAETPAAVPGEWPTWRGPNRDGLSAETGLLSTWPADGPPVAWEAKGLGTGYSSVSVSGGRIYASGRDGGGERLHAIDAKTGRIEWSTEIGPGRAEKGPNGTPTVDGNRVYAISFAGDLLCADAETGAEVWKKSFAGDFGGQMMSMWGYSESPLIDGDRLLCTPGGERAMMVALDKATGETLWTAPLPSGGDRGKDGAGYSSIVISRAGGVKQYVQLIGRGLIGVSEAGKPLWGYERVANSTANVPTPIVSGDYVFCSSGYDDGGSALLQIGRAGVREVYYKPARELQNHHGGMILLDGMLYLGHGHNNGFPTCVDLRTGRPAWGPGRGPGGGSAAVAYADGHLYFRYEDGVMALIEATPQAYRLKSSFKEPNVRDRTWPQPVIADKKLYLRDQDTLRCYDIAAK